VNTADPDERPDDHGGQEPNEPIPALSHGSESDPDSVSSAVSRPSARPGAPASPIRLPDLYESGAINRLRGILDNLTVNSVLKHDLDRIFTPANVVPSTAHLSAFLGASDIAKTAGSSLLGKVFESSAASSSIAQLFSHQAWLPETTHFVHPFFAEDRARIFDLSAHIAGVMPKFDFKVVIPELQWPLALGSEAWDLAARVAPATPDAAAVWRLRDAGRTTLGMSTAGLLLSGTDEEWDYDEELEEDNELVTGPEDARHRLLAELGHLDSNLVNRLEGAWERASRPGPDAASQAANSLVELITWTLRRAAPTRR